MRCFEDFDGGEDFRSGTCVHHPVVGFHVRQNSQEEIWLEESRTKLASVKLNQLSEPGVIFGGQETIVAVNYVDSLAIHMGDSPAIQSAIQQAKM
jgi:hypothetical protein